MRVPKEHISVIIDEYGSMRGIVTMEDVIETMLGVEIVDESDEAVNMQDMAREKWEQQQKHQENFAERADTEEPAPDANKA